MVRSVENGSKKSLPYVMVLLLIISGTVPLILITSEIVSGALLYVGQDSTYAKISYAVENSTRGDTIIVSPGIYDETINIDIDGIDLVGNDTHSTIIEALPNDPAIMIGSNNVAISGFTLEGGGIHIDGDNSTCSNLSIKSRSLTGVHVNNSTNTTLINITLEDFDNQGILAHNSSYLNIIGLNVSGAIGIVASFLNCSNVGFHQSTISMNSTATGIHAVDVVNLNITHSTIESTNNNNRGIILENGTGVFIEGCDLKIYGIGSSGVAFDECDDITIFGSDINIINGSYGFNFLMSSNIDLNNCSFQINGSDSVGISILGSNNGDFKDLSVIISGEPGSLFSIYRSWDLQMSSSLIHATTPGSEMIGIKDSYNITIDHNLLSSSAPDTTIISASENTKNLSLLYNWFHSEEGNSNNVKMENTKNILIFNNSIEIRGELSTGHLLDSVYNVTIIEDNIKVLGQGSIGIQANGDELHVFETDVLVSGMAAMGFYFNGIKSSDVSFTDVKVNGEFATGIASAGTMSDLDINYTNIDVETNMGTAIATDHPQGRIGIKNVKVNSSISDLNALHLDKGTIEVQDLLLISNIAGMIVLDIDSGFMINSQITSSTSGITFDGSNVDLIGSNISTIRLNTGPGPLFKDSWIKAIDSTLGTIAQVDANSRLDILNTIGIQLLTKDLDPYPDVDLEIKSWEEVIYRTEFFNSTNPDPKTNMDGMISEMIFLDKVYNGSEVDPTIGYTNLTVHVFGNSVMAWDDTITLNTSYPHDEVFISPDIDLPGIPFNFTIRQGETKQTLFLNWEPNNDDTIEYWIYQLDPATSIQELVDKVNSTQSSWGSPDLGPSKQMYYWITSWDGTWESEPTSLVSGTTKDLTAPLSPEIFLGDTTKDSIMILWTHPGPADLAGFIIHISRPGSPDFEELDTVGPDLREYTVTGLEWGSTYQFRVQAFDDSNNSSPMGDILDVKTLIPLFEIRVHVIYGSEGPMSGQNAENCLLELLAFNGSFIVATETDENGTASFFVNPFETYTIRAIPETPGEIDLRSGYLQGLCDPVTIDGQVEVTQVNFTLDHYLRIVSGTIRLKVLFGEGPRSGRPVYGATVNLLHENGTILFTNSTDADGTIFFQVSELPIRARFHIIPPEGTGGDQEQNRSGYLEMMTNFFELTFDDPDMIFENTSLVYYSYIPPPEDLEIISIAPFGTAVDIGSPIMIKFNQPVDTSSVKLALSINPPLQNAIYIWEESNKTLRIEHDDLIPKTDYMVTIGIGARSEEGTAFPVGYQNNTFSFRTTALPDSQPADDETKYIVYAIGIGAIVLIIIILIYSRVSSKKREEDEQTRSYSPFEDYEEDDELDEEFYDEDYPDDIAQQMDDELPYEDEDEFDEFEDEYDEDYIEEEGEFDEFEDEFDEEDEAEIEGDEELEEDEGMDEDGEMEELEEEEEEPSKEPELKSKKKKKK